MTSSQSPFTVQEKTAIITGAGSGINLAFAELLLAQRCNVVFADLALRPEAEQVVTSHAQRAAFVQTDVTSWAALRHMFEFAVHTFGGFDIVCPGAGVYEPAWSSFWHPPGSANSQDDPEGDRYRLFDINITHPVRTSQLAISYWTHPRLPEGSKFPLPAKASVGNPKRIIHISSVAAQFGGFTAPLYGASKFAITGFVRCLGPLEAGTGIRVCAVAPGIVRTPLWTDNLDKLKHVNQDTLSWVTPQEVAEAMLGCVESTTMAGGTVMEVGRDHLREVNMFNDPGPDRRLEKGLRVETTVPAGGGMSEGYKEIMRCLENDTIWG